MDLTNKEELNFFLKTQGIHLTKKFGQHFLVSRDALDEIVSAAEIEENDLVIETGAGVGTLTLELAEKSERVVAIEIDEKVASALRVSLGAESKVEMIKSDALEIDIPKEKWKWVANLPYQITSPLLKKFFAQDNPPEVAVLMMQKEVGEKICSKKENRLSLMVKNFMKVEKVCSVNRDDFFPPPEVDSIVLKFMRRDKPMIELEKYMKLEKVMKVAFMNKRKKLRNTLKAVFGAEVEEKLEEAGIDPNSRPEEVGLDLWKKLV